MVEIPLANNRGMALVDDADAPSVLQYKWRVKQNKHDHTAYAIAWAVVNGKSCLIYMHRLLIPGAARVDHIDGNGLNNQRENLRPVTHAQNMMNTRPYRGKRFKGVSFVRSTGRWRAYIHAPHHRKQINLGFFATEEEAALAYDHAALEMFGEHARLNLPNRPPAIVLADLDRAA